MLGLKLNYVRKIGPGSEVWTMSIEPVSLEDEFHAITIPTTNFQIVCWMAFEIF